MADTDNIKVIPVDIHKDGNDSHHDGNNVVNQPGGQVAGANSMTNFHPWVEQNKISEFYGEKGKDTTSDINFIRRLDQNK